MTDIVFLLFFLLFYTPTLDFNLALLCFEIESLDCLKVTECPKELIGSCLLLMTLYYF